MADEIVGLAELSEAITDQIRDLTTVDNAFEYAGQFDSKDFSLVSSNAEWGTTCFVSLMNGAGDTPKRHILNDIVNVKVFVMGLQDMDEEATKQGVSSMCFKTIDELKRFIVNNNFGFALPQETRSGNWDTVNVTTDEEQRIRIAGYVFSFTVTIKSASVEPWQI